MAEEEEFEGIENVDSSSGETAQVISSIIDATEGFSQEVTSILNSLLGLVQGYNAESVSLEIPDLQSPLQPVLSSPMYMETTADFAAPDFGVSLPTFDVPDVTVGEIPDLDIDIPAFLTPEAPDVDLPAFNVDAPTISAPTLPARPTYTLPPLPQLSTLTVPDPPSYDLPDFDGESPVMDITPPSGELNWSEDGYNSQLKTQLEGRVTTDLADIDATGIAAPVESAIYGRARTRQLEDNNRMVIESINFFRSRGFSPPSAAIASAEAEAVSRAAQSDTNMDNDVTIIGAKLAQQHKAFVIDTSIGWEEKLVAYHDKAADRALSAAKAHTEVAIEVYRAKVEGYLGQTEVYSAMADVYRSRISAELAKAEFYKAQIEGKKLTIEAQRAMIMAYIAQVASIEIIAKIYATETEAAKIQAEIDTERMRSYVELVKANRAHIEAMAAQYKLYVARVMGEAAKVKMYEALVQAYEAQVQAHIARIKVDVSRLRIQVEQLKGQAEAFAAQVQKYAADVTFSLGKAEVGVLAHHVSNTNTDAAQRVQENTMAYLGQVQGARAREKAAQERAKASVAAADQKSAANIAMTGAHTSAGITKNLARAQASEIARFSVTENWSTTDTASDNTVEKSRTNRKNYPSQVIYRHNKYWRTYHD